MGRLRYGISGSCSPMMLSGMRQQSHFYYRSQQLHRNYDNGAPGMDSSCTLGSFNSSR